MKFEVSKNVNILLAAVIFAFSLSAFAGFVYLKREDPLAFEIKRLADRRLPRAVLPEIETKKDFYDEVVTGEVTLIYLISTCQACRLELDLIARSNVEGKAKIFGIMLESEEVVKKYIREKDIRFPVLIDKNAEISDALEIKHFPANLRLRDGVIKNVILGTPENTEKFLDFVNN